MTALDWTVMVGTLAFIAGYGAWKNRKATSAASYLRGDNDLRWPTIGLSVMATQASAITFLSMPGQAYEDGLRFVQMYFGQPLALIIVCAVFVPIYYKLDVFTAYQYLERRFDVRVRVLAAGLFLLGRGLATGISIYAPAIILSSLLGWSLNLTNLVLGLTVIVYTVSGGSKAVSQTQRQQMMVIMAGILVAAVVITLRLPDNVSLNTATHLAGAAGLMNAVDFSFSVDSRYNIWSGLAGGLFLALSYFGTDQSQVARYLGGKSVTESRLGLLFNGILKIPMQLLILFIGLLVFVFFLFERPPVFFNQPTVDAVYQTEHAAEFKALEGRWDAAFAARKGTAEALAARYAADPAALVAPAAPAAGADAPTPEQAAVIADPDAALARARADFVAANQAMKTLRTEAKALIHKALPNAEIKDSDYIFVSFVLRYLPAGLVGLLLAVILAAAMSSTASELTALGGTTVVDFYKRLFRPNATDAQVLRASKLFTVFWGLVAVAFATFAALLDNLIQAVNILGSVFYGVILGIFLVAFFFKWVRALPTFIAAAVGQVCVVGLYFASDIGFLWFNVIGCGLVVGMAVIFDVLLGRRCGPSLAKAAP